MLDFSEIKPYKTYNTTINGKPIVDSCYYYNQNILSLSDDELIKLEKEWKEVEEYNKLAFLDNIKAEEKLVKQVEEFFKDFGMPTYKYKGSKKTGSYVEFSKFLEAVKNKIKRPPGTTPFLNKLKYNNEEFDDCHSYHLKTLVEKVKYFKSRIEHVENIKKAKEKEYRLAISLAPKYGISLDDEMILEKVREANKQEYIDTHYSDGTEMHIKFCDECSTWHVGSHRCSCGNCRCYLEVDGSIGNWYAYAMNG